MRLDWLKIKKFKNLENFAIDFDENELSTVLIGENGTGKSNVIEALVTIFRDLDLAEPTTFQYAVAYRCYGSDIEIDNGYAKKGLSVTVDGQLLGRGEFSARKTRLRPGNVFGYYSGTSRRLEQLFDKHQVRYYRKVIAPESKPEEIDNIDLRRLFYCRPAYGQLALLSYFALGLDSARAFLRKHMNIKDFDSALLVLRKPRWATPKPTQHQLTHGDPRFWYSAGLVKQLLEKLWEHALAPIGHRSREQDDYRVKPAAEEQLYIFIKDAKTLRQIATHFKDEKTFFALLETLDISDLVREVRIWVTRPKASGEIPFHEISDGEKQLLSVLGLMRFAGRDESLFLLDEPDTHLNPAWKWDYLELVKEVAQKNSESHIVMTSHDPLTMGGLKASQVQVMAVNSKGQLVAQAPDVDPRGLGFTSILTQIFGLRTTVDPDTQHRLEERNSLLRIDKRTREQEKRLLEISQQLSRLGFMIEDREPEYEAFLRAYEAIKTEGRATLTPEQIANKNEVAKRMLAEIMAKTRVRS
jgi:ABC-type multidrug transport system ATPase subunit